MRNIEEDSTLGHGDPGSSLLPSPGGYASAEEGEAPLVGETRSTFSRQLLAAIALSSPTGEVFPERRTQILLSSLLNLMEDGGYVVHSETSGIPASTLEASYLLSARESLRRVDDRFLATPCAFQGSTLGHCTVCMGPIDEGSLMPKLRCRHGFHWKCLQEWVKRRAQCPLCSAPVEVVDGGPRDRTP